METTLSRLQALCNTVILASATILALVLTLLGLSTGTDTKRKPVFYQRIQQLAFSDALVFVAAMPVFLLLNIPIKDAPSPWWAAGGQMAVSKEIVDA